MKVFLYTPSIHLCFLLEATVSGVLRVSLLLRIRAELSDFVTKLELGVPYLEEK